MIKNKNQNLAKFYNKKKILVIGGSGFIGTNLILRLADFKCQILGTFNKKKPIINFNKKKIKFKKLNLLEHNNKNINFFKNFDYVFMCAANTSGAKIIEKKPLDHLTPNIIMNTRALELAYQSNVKKFCFISSSTVYPNKKKIFKETDVNYKFYEKYFIVGWMKLFSEKMCKMYSEKIKNVMETLVVRPSNLYGPYDKFEPKLSKVIPSLIVKGLSSERYLNVWGDGKDVKDFLYIEDFIEGLLYSFTKKKLKIVNISSGISVSLRRIIKIIISNTNRKLIPKFQKNQPSMIQYRKISNKLIKKSTKWMPKVSLKDGIIHTINWYKNNH